MVDMCVMVNAKPMDAVTLKSLNMEKNIMAVISAIMIRIDGMFRQICGGVRNLRIVALGVVDMVFQPVVEMKNLLGANLLNLRLHV